MYKKSILTAIFILNEHAVKEGSSHQKKKKEEGSHYPNVNYYYYYAKKKKDITFKDENRK